MFLLYYIEKIPVIIDDYKYEKKNETHTFRRVLVNKSTD